MNALQAVSFCVTCHNRLWQLKQTLHHNLRVLEEGMEIILVDYHSTDGLSAWVWDHFADQIEGGKLVFFQVLNEVSWSAPIAKNLAHRLSGKDYLFNLDGDNFITSDDIKAIKRAMAERQPCHQWSGDRKDGSFGRIGLPRRLFAKLGGYDECLLPMGSQDFDLLWRLEAVKRAAVRLPPPQLTAVQNQHHHKIAAVNARQVDPKQYYLHMIKSNRAVASFKLNHMGPLRLGGYATFRGLLNGREIIFDGLNNRHKITQPRESVDAT